jgi:hypothetical protein
VRLSVSTKTVKESGPADAVILEITAPVLGNDVPIALAYARFSRPETRTVRLVAPRNRPAIPAAPRPPARARGRLAMHHGGL